MRLLLPLVLVFTLFAAACGDDGGGTQSAAGFCDRNNQIEASLDGIDAEFEAAFGEGDFSGLGEYFGEALDLMRGSLGSAPSEIRDDVGTLIAGFETFVEVMEDYDYNLFAIPEDEPRLAALDDPEFDAASDRISAYCGVDDDDSDGGTDVGTDDDTSDGTPVDDGGAGGDDDSDDPDVGFDEDQMTDLVAQGLATSFGIDIDLARCIVAEAGLTDPESIDPSVFGDLSTPICGTTMGEILTGG